jgi:hypothetical protein
MMFIRRLLSPKFRLKAHLPVPWTLMATGVCAKVEDGVALTLEIVGAAKAAEAKHTIVASKEIAAKRRIVALILIPSSIDHGSRQASLFLQRVIKGVTM